VTDHARSPVRVLGIDGAGRHGWVGVVVDGAGYVDAALGSLVELVAWAEPVDVVGIDIPIGHAADGGRRPADVEARRFVAPLGSSVFPAPPEAVLGAATYAEANAALVALGVPQMSRQAWALVPRIVEAAELATADDRVFEVHPEVSFCELAGEPLPWSKKSWNGLMLRRQLLAAADVVLPAVIPEVGGAASDDVVDAAVVAWSARRIARGDATSLPDPPDVVAGRRVAIWR
jgi:predicted RNase H-like nuclease